MTTLPIATRRCFIFRAPFSETEKFYSVFSESKDYLIEVAIQRLEKFGTSWVLLFESSSGVTKVHMKMNSESYQFTKATGEEFGRVRETSFSLTGKSVVEDEMGNVIGFVVSRPAKLVLFL